MLIQRLPRSPFAHKREPTAQTADAAGLGTRVRGHDARKPRFRLAGLLSIGLHAVLLVGLLLWFRHAPPSGDDPQASGAVELVMLEQQGSGVPAAPHEPAPAIAAPVAPPDPRSRRAAPASARRRDGRRGTARCRPFRRPRVAERTAGHARPTHPAGAARAGGARRSSSAATATSTPSSSPARA